MALISSASLSGDNKLRLVFDRRVGSILILLLSDESDDGRMAESIPIDNPNNLIELDANCFGRWIGLLPIVEYDRKYDSLYKMFVETPTISVKYCFSSNFNQQTSGCLGKFLTIVKSIFLRKSKGAEKDITICTLTIISDRKIREGCLCYEYKSLRYPLPEISENRVYRFSVPIKHSDTKNITIVKGDTNDNIITTHDKKIA